MHQLDRIEEGLSRLLAGLPDNPDFLRRADVARQVEDLFRAFVGDRKIEAIRNYRMLTGLGLKESKDAVDTVYAALSRRVA